MEKRLIAVLAVFFAVALAIAAFRIQKQNSLQAQEKEIARKIAVLEKENSALKTQRDELDARLAEIKAENENLQAQVSSEKELKKAMDELGRQARQVGMGIQQRLKDSEIGEGNRGIVQKEGTGNQQ